MIPNAATNLQQNDGKREESRCSTVKRSQSPELSLTEMLWWGLKRAVKKCMSANLDELKQESARIHPPQYELTDHVKHKVPPKVP